MFQPQSFDEFSYDTLSLDHESMADQPGKLIFRQGQNWFIADWTHTDRLAHSLDASSQQASRVVAAGSVKQAAKPVASLNVKQDHEMPIAKHRAKQALCIRQKIAIYSIA